MRESIHPLRCGFLCLQGTQSKRIRSRWASIIKNFVDASNTRMRTVYWWLGRPRNDVSDRASLSLSNAVVSAKSPFWFSSPCTAKAVGIAHKPPRSLLVRSTHRTTTVTLAAHARRGLWLAGHTILQHKLGPFLIQQSMLTQRMENSAGCLSQ